MNRITNFFRLLSSPISAKGDDLRQQIDALNQGQPFEGVFQINPAEFGIIPGSPFAYWVSSKTKNIFAQNPMLETETTHACSGTSTGDDFRFLRLFWEVEPAFLTTSNDWISFPKGGSFSPFYADPHLVINWLNNGELIRLVGFIRNSHLYHKPGLTWPARTNGFSVRILPSNCIFSHKGPVITNQDDNIADLLALLSVMNSSTFSMLVKMQLARTELAQSYEVGLIQQTPIPARLQEAKIELGELALKAYKLVRSPYLRNEITHIFCLSALVATPGATLADCLLALAEVESKRLAELETIQAEIDAFVAELYGVPELAHAVTEQSSVGENPVVDDENQEGEEEDDEAIEKVIDPISHVSDLLMWCVGAAFGRWDVRKALDPSRLPELPGPFDPLPVCSPGMLTGSDGLPMRQDELPEDYPLPVAWDGFLVDDPGHPRDILSAVERTLKLFWPGRLEEVEREAGEILGVPDLRAWFRDPKGFFAFHTKRYSKSRRKAPIYWPLQSAKRSYTIWLYYPRLHSGSLYHAGREYADAKLKLEAGRLEDWQRSLATTSGSARKLQERKIASQEALVEELKAFVKALDAAALLELKPDLDDGVLLNIAPLHELTPWKEAGRAWGELLHGSYEWSSIGKQLKERRMTKSR